MPDSLLIMAPLVVLAVVLFLGFAGCSFEPGRLPPKPDPGPTPPTTLTFRAAVPTALTVLGGVRFAWKRPNATAEETVTVTSFIKEEVGNVYEHQVPSPEAGMGWLGRCEMIVSEGSDVSDGSSGDQPFDLPAFSQSVVLFQGEGSPLAPPFRVRFKGRLPA